jgi:hypothetical protein
VTTTPTGSVLVANGSHTTQYQVDSAAYAALQQQLSSNYASKTDVQQAKARAVAMSIVFRGR